MLNHRPDHGTPVVLSNPSIALYTQHQLTPNNAGTITDTHDDGTYTVTWDSGAVVRMRPDELDRTYVEHTLTVTVRTMGGADFVAQDVYEALSRDLAVDSTISVVVAEEAAK
ncbi:hypothetical protein [Curtobacterium sp. MCSS17_016]|uniref:hypothetical protein n=1 Tax=Curtobacterium sp. MCSS17_016 TaxID=2175644 RepID=UPI000DA9C663|nr:hypothetical protein [Curtobacterium sp. MCSS17_016]WIE81281.1 hypothetical protein DEJ19_018785 [Curtobacterium sp. MCSS17_016]